MKKEYMKPEVEVLNFELQESIMDISLDDEENFEIGTSVPDEF